jgi:hypothetical protein
MSITRTLGLIAGGFLFAVTLVSPYRKFHPLAMEAESGDAPG